MSTLTNASREIPNRSPGARALRNADSSIKTWLTELVTGAGSSPSQIIVTGILGVVPGVGQAMDARDLIIGIISIAKSPAAIGGWVELVITLIGCVPAVGDALKVGFKLMKQGHNFGRVLEAVSPSLKGNVEKFMRKIDWTMLASHSKDLFSKSIAAFIDGLDSWVIKAVAGGPQVKQIVSELKGLQKAGGRMIDQAFDELKRLHSKMMPNALPANTAAISSTSTRAAKRETGEITSAAKVTAKPDKVKPKATLIARKTRVTTVSPNTTKTSVKKAAKPKRQKERTGIPAEHLTDYYVKRKFTSYTKVNHHGKLTEEYSPTHDGVDHLWITSAPTSRDFVVCDKKSSIFDSFKLMAALPEKIRREFEVLKATEADDPLENGKPNIFESPPRDKYANRTVAIEASAENDAAIKLGVNRPNEKTGLKTQMTHQWIANAIKNDDTLTPSGKNLEQLIDDYFLGEISCPYERWLCLVTGRQLYRHRKSKGRTHQIQTTLHLPDNILI